MTLDKDGFLAKIEQDKNNKKIIKVHVDNWNEDVHLREMSSGERSKLESYYVGADPDTFKYLRAHYVCACLCNEDGSSMFPCTKESFDKVGQGGAAAIDQIYDYVLDLNGVSKKEQQKFEQNFLMKKEQDSSSSD